METKDQQNPQLKKVKELVGDIRTAMLTTIDEGGHLVSRPMACMQMDEQGNFWFFTQKSSPKVEQIEQHEQQVNLSFADTGDASYVSVAGTATELDDRAKIDELWSDMAKPWFPEGKEDPQLTVLKVTPHLVEYWDSSASRMVRYAEMARAIVTGDTYKEGENKKITLA
ncbi:MAG: pyridoxamine 5'-phosphate oxidase family protein [Bacteroidetes bacterium]|nr:pyridoxamine 5'-phosphate oxidase family protein [Fibrella sp.]